MVTTTQRSGTLTYDVLPTSTSTRLLSLIKRNDAEDYWISGNRVIKCHLKTVDLDDAPVYKALSYTWGHPFEGTQPESLADAYGENDLLPLEVNGTLISIRRNLYEALDQFLDPASSTSQALSIDRQKWERSQKTELIHAAEDGRMDRLAYCLRRGGNPNIADKFGQTALHYAAESGNLDIVKVLLAYGADPELVDRDGWTPLMYCRERQNGQALPVAKALTEHSNKDREASVSSQYAGGQLMGFDLWVDSICINQADIPERNAQVAKMATIYTSAVSVVAWLGPADAETEHLHAVFPADHDTVRSSDPSTKTPTWENVDDVSKSCRLLHARSWFSRRWIIQELCLADCLEMYCGDFQINPFFWRMGIVFALGPGFDAIFRLLCLRRWYASATGKDWWAVNPQMSQLPGLAALLTITWGSRSTDPRDSIFALLGLASQAPPAKMDWSEMNMVADYSTEVTKVFLEASRQFIEARADSWANGNGERSLVLEPLEALSYAQNPPCQVRSDETNSVRMILTHSKRVSGVPSWCPMFHQELGATRIFNRKFSAAGTTQYKPQPLVVDHSLLRVSGLFIDKIVEAEDKSGEHHHGRVCFRPNLYAWFDILSRLQDPNLGTTPDITRLDLLERTLTAGEVSRDSEASNAAESKYFLWDIFAMFLPQVQISDEECESLLQLITSVSTPNEPFLPVTMDDIREIQRLPTQCSDVFSRLGPTQSRRLVRSHLGYLGLCFLDAQPGDEIWLLAGGRTPFTLRPIASKSSCEPRRFQFVGECFVHGFMFGEAFDCGQSVGLEQIDLV